MSTSIFVTHSPEIQAEAASVLSQHLAELECPHAFIVYAIPSLKPYSTFGVLAHDIDVLVEPKGLDMSQLRERLESMDRRFVLLGIKMYFVHEPVEGLRGEELVYASKNNVTVETLKVGTLGLPTVAEPTYLVEVSPGHSLAILSPPVLLLTKMKRWYLSHESTRPKTVSKNQSDKNDLDFLVYCLAANDMKIDFNAYKGKEKPDLLNLIRAYRHKVAGDAALSEALRSALHKEDWDAIQPSP